MDVLCTHTESVAIPAQRCTLGWTHARSVLCSGLCVRASLELGEKLLRLSQALQECMSELGLVARPPRRRRRRCCLRASSAAGRTRRLLHEARKQCALLFELLLSAYNVTYIFTQHTHTVPEQYRQV